jgi:hypothetical protein
MVNRGVQRFACGSAESAPQSPASPAESHVRHRGKSRLVGAKGEQEVRGTVGRGEGRFGGFDAVAVNATAARSDKHGASLSQHPDPEPAGLKHQPGAFV